MQGLGDQVRKSLGVYAAGKAVSAVCAIVLLLLLARQLPQADYALYVTLQGLILIVGAVTSFGINQALLRFLPELLATGQRRTLYRLLWRSLGTRVLVTTVAFAGLACALPWLPADWAGSEQRGMIVLYFAVGVVRLVGYFVVRAMEALLWQRLAQVTVAASAAVKLALVVLIWQGTGLDFAALVWLELAVESVLLLVLLTSLAWRQRRDEQGTQGDTDWIARYRNRFARYGRWNYLSSLAGQLSTSSPYRLLAGALLSVEETAAVGFAFSLVDLLYRFLPINLGRILIRSVAVAQASAGTPLDSVARQLNLSLRACAAIVVAAAAVATAAGLGGASWLSGGRYPQAGPLVAALLVVLVLDVVRSHYELLAEVAERPGSALGGNALLVIGLALAWSLHGFLGAFSLVAGAALGQVASIAFYRHRLRTISTCMLVDRRLLTLCACAAAAATAGAVASTPWPAAAAIALLILLAGFLLFKPIDAAELQVLRRRGASLDRVR